jgi:integrase
MITLYRRGKVWWACSTFRGQRRRWSLQTRDRQIASELLRASQLEILGNGKLTDKRWEHFRQEFEAWIRHQVAPKTLQNYSYLLGVFERCLQSLGIATLREIDAAVIARYTDDRQKSVHRINRRRITPGAIKFDLRILHRVFAFAVERGYCEKNPVTIRNRNATPGKTLPFSRDEVKAMLSSPYLNDKPYLRAIVLLFLHTGLRIGDVIHLRRDSIHDRILHLQTKKRGTTVRIELHKNVLDALQQVPHRPPSPYLFTTSEGRPIVSLDKHLRRLWKACGVAGGHAHRFRDTFAVNILAAGGSLYDAAKLLGISHYTAELHYTPYVEDLQERAAKLTRALSFTANA